MTISAQMPRMRPQHAEAAIVASVVMLDKIDDLLITASPEQPDKEDK